MNEITTIAQSTGLRTLGPSELARIDEGMREQKRIEAIFGRRNSQTTLKLATLTMLAASPLRQLRQVAAEVQRRAMALREAGFAIKRKRLQAERARSRAAHLDGAERDLLLLRAEELDWQNETSLVYAEGALKDIAALMDAYQQIRKSANLRESWDEADFEAGEIEHHLKALFRIAYRDMLATGRVRDSAAEYAEQFGVHPQVLRARVMKYQLDCDLMMAGHPGEDGKPTEKPQAPTIEHFHAWLQTCFEAHRNDVQLAVKHNGLTELITRWSLYVEPEG